MSEPQVIPRIRVARGSAVVRGESGRNTSREDAKDVIAAALERWDTVIVVDEDGVRRNRPDLELLKAFEGEAIWVEAGHRTADGVIDVLVAGAEAAIMGTGTLRDMRELWRAHAMTENLLFQLDFHGSLVAPYGGSRRPSAHALRDEAAGLGVRGVIVMDEDGWRGHRDLLSDLEVPLYAGLGTENDAPDLERLGASGVIVSKEALADG